MLVEKPGQLADRHSMPHRNGKQPHERRVKPGATTGPSTCVPPIGLGRSQTTGTPAWRPPSGSSPPCADVGVNPCSDVLQINNERVQTGQHLSRGHARFAVEGTCTPRVGSSMWGDSIMLSCTSDRKPCWGPKMAPTHARALGAVDDMTEAGVYRSGIADQSDRSPAQ